MPEPRISLCMIARNEEVDLPICLDSVQPHVDEVVLVDTGSDDRTREVARARGVRVYDYDRGSDPEGFLLDAEGLGPAPHSGNWFLADFAAARQKSFTKATGDFLLWVDADDLVEGAENLRAVAAEMVEKKLDAAWFSLAYDRDGERVSGELWRERLVRRGVFRWAGAVHEVLTPYSASCVRSAAVRVVQRARSGKANESRVAHRNLKILLHERRRVGDAVEPRALFYLANEARWPDPELAIRTYAEYLKKSTWAEERAFARLYLGRLYEDRGDLASAWREYTLAAAAPYVLPETHFALARVAYLRQDWRRCAEETERGLRLPCSSSLMRNPLDTTFWPHLYYNVALFHLGRVGEALASCRAGLGVQEHAQLRQNVGFYEGAIAAGSAEVHDVVLTVGVLSVSSRAGTFLPGIVAELTRQAEGRPVEVLALLDNWKSTVGAKRNEVARMARGKYLAFVDDDDRVAPDYVEAILAEVAADPETDCVVFGAWATQAEGDPGKLTAFGVELAHAEEAGRYTRKPTHVCCHLTRNVRAASFPELNHGEDVEWAHAVCGLIKRQRRIDRVLYYYDYRDQTTETRPDALARRAASPPPSFAGPWRAEKFAVTVVSPPGMWAASTFLEAAESVHYGLLELGYDSVMTTETRLPGRRHVVLGSVYLPWYRADLASDAILYNFEQVGTRAVPPELVEVFRRYAVWDYSLANIARLREVGVAAAHVPLGYADQLARIEPAAEDVDVLFYGSMNERRQRVVDELRARGHRVETLFGVVGAARDAWVARSKIVLNLHYYETKVFESVRVTYLLANGRFVVSETGLDPEEREFEGGVAFAEYDRVVDTCCAYLADEEGRRRVAERGREIMRARRSSAHLARALGETPRVSASRKPAGAQVVAPLRRVRPRPRVDVFVNNYNRLNWPRAMVERILTLPDVGEVVVVDNASTYGPLLEWYSEVERAGVTVDRLSENLGPSAPWKSGSVARREADFYVVTDPDLDISGVPDDVLSHLVGGLTRHGVLKAGLSLEISDLPDTWIGSEARRIEGPNWGGLSDGFYPTPVDTTFAVYKNRDLMGLFLTMRSGAGLSDQERYAFLRAVRADRPYTARHLPWYITPETMTDEDRFYLGTATTSTEVYWTRIMADRLRRGGDPTAP